MMKRLVITCVCLTGITIVPAMAAEPEMGRLFHTPETRLLLETKRGVNPKPVIAKKSPTKNPVIKQAQPALPLPDPIMLQGYVKRSDGPNTIWINHEPLNENSKTQSIKVGQIKKHTQSKQNSLLAKHNRLKKIDQLSIHIPANGKVISLKPGQRYVPAENRVEDITVIESYD